MACVIAAPSSGSGKTILSMVLSAWARNKGFKIQPFKIGPDYLDPQQLTIASDSPCRNLDLFLSGSKWISDDFFNYGSSADLALIEGVMGLFDGVGTSQEGSTADIARRLNLPVVLVIEAKGQAASLAALVKGFINHDPHLKFAGVVLNKINSHRHKQLLAEVLESIDIDLLGCLPNDPELKLPSRHLGLVPAHEIKQLEKRLEAWCLIAESNLNLEVFRNLLKPPKKINGTIKDPLIEEIESHKSRPKPIAIAQDDAFHFQYQGTKEWLESLGMPVISWSPLKNERIPKEAMGIILPGGFPEQHAATLSSCSRSLIDLRDAFGKLPIYAECGGMLLLGRSLTDLNGEIHKMTGLLPFHAQKGTLKVGYRNLRSIRNSILLKDSEELAGHEFHYWKINNSHAENNPSYESRGKTNAINIKCPWLAKGWRIKESKEGWCNNTFHASWIHLHWPSNPRLSIRWRDSL